MFNECNSLQILDLSGWNIGKVTNTVGMFGNCTNLKTIYTSEQWGNNSQVTDGSLMFRGCINLSGAIKYDSSKVDITYANYDTGYFTYKAIE